ncbi:hypothetical protein FDUTEX481_04775 [Tolypothrix sp. PCC 7601]|nr:hypothetical protein FDUTEX481_04775 [Tolypothrix sp. PCC 7601]
MLIKYTRITTYYYFYNSCQPCATLLWQSNNLFAVLVIGLIRYLDNLEL